MHMCQSVDDIGHRREKKHSCDPAISMHFWFKNSNTSFVCGVWHHERQKNTQTHTHTHKLLQMSIIGFMNNNNHSSVLFSLEMSSKIFVDDQRLSDKKQRLSTFNIQPIKLWNARLRDITVTSSLNSIQKHGKLMSLLLYALELYTKGICILLYSIYARSSAYNFDGES